MEQEKYKIARDIQNRIYLAEKDLSDIQAITVNGTKMVVNDNINVNDYGVKQQAAVIIENAIKARLYELQKQFNEL